MDYVCKCGKKCKNASSLNGHRAHCKVYLGEDRYQKIRSGLDNSIKAMADSHRGVAPWNKGLTADSSESVSKQRDTYRERFSAGEIVLPYKGLPRSEEVKAKISHTERMSHEIHRKKSVIPYKQSNGSTVYLDSSYELAFAQSLDKYGIYWERPKYLWYIDSSGKKRKYFPDFYLRDYDCYFDPKNDYLYKVDQLKISQAESYNNVRIIMLRKSECDWNIAKSLITLRDVGLEAAIHLRSES